MAPIYFGEQPINGMYLGQDVQITDVYMTGVLVQNFNTTSTTTPPALAGYIVSGAGTTAVNGTYCAAGTYGGYTYYKQDGAEYYILYDDGFGIWMITSSVSASEYFYIDSNFTQDPTPPLTGWNDDLGSIGSYPYPTLSQTTC